MNDNLGISELILEIRGWKAGTSDDSRRMVWLMNKAADEIERLEKEMRGWSKAAMNLFNSNATLIATLEYLRTQAKNGTLHPQVVILNADKALGEIKLLEGKNGLRN